MEIKKPFIKNGASYKERLFSLISVIKKTINGRRLYVNALWSLSGAIVSRLLGLISFIIVARLLGKEEYGQFAIVQSTIGLFGILAGFGLGQCMTKYIAEMRVFDPVRVGRMLALGGVVAGVCGGIMSVALYFSSPWLSESFFKSEDLITLLKISSIILMFEAMNGAQIGSMTGFESFKALAKISMWVSVVNLPALTVGVYLDGLEGVVWAIAIIKLVNWLMVNVAIRQVIKEKNIKLDYRFTIIEAKILFEYCLPGMISGLLISATLWVCNTMLVRQSLGFEQMGIFYAVNSLQQIILFVGAALSAPLLPMLANSIGAKIKNDQLDSINMLGTWMLGALPAIFLLSIPEMPQFIFGADFESKEFIDTFVIMTISTVIVMYKQGLSRAIAANGFMWLSMIDNAFWAALMIFFVWLFIPNGSSGYALAFVASYLLNAIVFMPVYFFKKLARRETIINNEVLAIWGLLVIGAGLSLLSVSIWCRILFAAMSLCISIYLFIRLINRNGFDKYIEVDYK